MAPVSLCHFVLSDVVPILTEGEKSVMARKVPTALIMTDPVDGEFELIAFVIWTTSNVKRLVVVEVDWAPTVTIRLLS